MIGFLRAVAILIAVALGLSVIRSVLGAIVRWLSGSQGEGSKPSRPEVRSGGVLRKCPVCGTYTPEATCVKGGGEWYCSERCRQTPRLDRPA